MWGNLGGGARGAAIVGVVVVGSVLASTLVFTHGGAAPVAQTAGGASRDAAETGPRARTAVLNAAHPVHAKPQQFFLTRAHSAVFNVRKLKSTVVKIERPENEDPFGFPGGEDEAADTGKVDKGAHDADSRAANQADASMPAKLAQKQMVQKSPQPSAAAPSPDSSFDGLDFATWGAGHPPDENGDVGPTYYIQTVNTSIGIYDKSNGNRVAAFTFNAFMSQGHFGNLCDTNNFGDPVVLYDSYEDRWFITDFAFALDGSGNVSPAHAFQCFAVSKTGDPVNGGWNFYSIEAPGGLGDYPKFGVWPDGIYMSANMFPYASGGSYFGFHAWALNKQQMYAGAPSPQVVDFAGDTSDFTVIPANSRLQAGAPPAGSPEYFVSTEQFLNAVSVYKFQVNWDKISTSTFTGPFTSAAPDCWPNASPANAATPANAADVLAIRAMAQAQYENQGGTESVWVDHTVNRGTFTIAACGGTNTNFATPRWYQTNVTGGTVAANVLQSATYDPDGANTAYRFIPSLAVDHSGDMALGYTRSNSTTNPQIKYAGRLSSDPLNTLPQTEQTLINGTGSQLGNCGPSTCVRWGDYSGMSLDPNGCEFWMTGEYYATNGLNDLTRIGSFHYPGCTTVGNGTASGVITAGGNPLSGATVMLGNRTTTSDVNGAYSFTVPAGTYASLSVSATGFNTATATTIVVPDGGNSNHNFGLGTSPQSGCFTDNTQSAFQRGVPNGCDLTASPGSVVLAKPIVVDQQNTAGTTTGTGTTTNVSWAGQTFTAGVSGQLTKADFTMFTQNCTSNPNLVVSIRATSGGSPTGADIASATIAGDNSGNTDTFVASFASPPTLTAGTQYALVVRTAASCGTGGYFWIRSSPGTYAGGLRVTSADSGSTWAQDSTRDGNFHTYMATGFTPSATFVSSLRDANPAAGSIPHWTTFSFSATTPANTGVKFQIAGSNNQYGPFNYVGPDGTASTFFTTSGADLSQFNGFRYLRYQATLSSTNSSVTPSLSSVQTCFTDVSTAAATTLTVGAATGTYGGTTTLSATLTSGAAVVPNETVNFTLNGSSVGGATTDANGVATLNNVSLSGINAGSYPTGVAASFAGDSSFLTSSGTSSLTVSKADQAILVTTHAPATAAVDDQFTVAATGGGSGNAIVYGSSGGCTHTGATYTITGTGTCSVTYNQAGNSNYNAAPQVTETVNSSKANQTIHVTTAAPSSAVYGTGFTVAATGGNSGNPVTYGSSGGCTNTGADFTMTSGSTDCTVTFDQAGNSNYNAATQVSETVTAHKADQTIDVTTSAPSSAAYNSSFDVDANAPGGAVSFSSSGVCTNVGAHFTMTSGTGTCAVMYDRAGDSNYNAAPQVSESVTASKLDQSITFIAPADRTYGNADFDPGATSSSGFAVSYSASGACSIVSGMVHLTGAGSCTVKADQAGDSNYSAAPQVQRTFSVAKAALSITANNRSKYFDQALTLGTTAFSSSGLVGSDSISGVTLASSGAAASAAGGNYPITASSAVAGSGTSLGNYTVTYHSGTLHVSAVGLIGLTGVTVSGSGGKIDSFDSTLGVYGPSNHGSTALALSNAALSFSGVQLLGSTVSTMGSVSIASSASVSGNVTAGTTVSNSGTVSGTVTQHAPQTSLSTPAVAACSPKSGKTGISGGTFTLSSGNLTVKKGTVKLASKTYCFNNVTLNSGAKLQVTGAVTIKLTGKLTGAGTIVNTTNLPAKLHINSSFSSAGGVSIKGGTNVALTIVAPKTSVAITGGSFFGTVLAGTVSLSGVAFHADQH